MQWGALPVDAMTVADRRLEAEAYLLSGYGIRSEIEHRNGWRRLGEIANVWQPSRLKGILVSREHGTPFLSATQVFDLRPTPRKFLAIERTENAQDRFVTTSTILVTCSGTVGLTTIAHSPHVGVLISHDLLRVQPTEENQIGWLYAFLRSQQARAMMSSAQYGHVIKHLECPHLEALPVPRIGPSQQVEFYDAVRKIFSARDTANGLMAEAEKIYENVVGDVPSNEMETFAISSTELDRHRRRVEAFHHNRTAAAVFRQFGETRLPIERLDQNARVWWLTRFKRVFGETGMPYVSAEELFTLNPPIKKRVMIEQAEQPERFYVRAGWLAMACSGQIYGLNGSVALLSRKHERMFLSHDVLRIAPIDERIRPGYLLIALGHPKLGRPLAIRLAYGTSIPHIDPADAAAIPVLRLGEAEKTIADLAERAVELRDQADTLEDEITEKASVIVDDFVKRQPAPASTR